MTSHDWTLIYVALAAIMVALLLLASMNER